MSNHRTINLIILLCVEPTLAWCLRYLLGFERSTIDPSFQCYERSSLQNPHFMLVICWSRQVGNTGQPQMTALYAAKRSAILCTSRPDNEWTINKRNLMLCCRHHHHYYRVQTNTRPALRDCDRFDAASFTCVACLQQLAGAGLVGWHQLQLLISTARLALAPSKTVKQFDAEAITFEPMRSDWRLSKTYSLGTMK